MELLKERFNNLIVEIHNMEELFIKNGYALTYERGKSRQKELVNIIRDTIPHFALTPEEFDQYLETKDVGEQQRIAWSRISKAKKESKGDYGELLLFLFLSCYYPTERFVTKVRLRSSRKDQIKGFDCAHFTIENNEVYLWLGEAKFYNDFSNAKSHVIKEIQEHCEDNYIDEEFSILASNIEINKASEVYNKIYEILNRSKSFDDFNIVVPTLITYNCRIVNSNKAHNDKFITALKNDLIKKFKKLEDSGLNLPTNIKVLFIVLPLENVDKIKTYLEKIEQAYI